MSSPTTALLLIDLINTFEFEAGAALEQRTRRILPNLQRLLRRARSAGVPVIYVNDHFGHWRSDLPALLDRIEASRGADVLAAIRPVATDYFLLKPRHSAFFASPLPVLLGELAVERLVLCGIETCSCVYLTACDAHLRKLSLMVPEDCCAARTPRLHREAVHLMQETLGARTGSGSSIRLASAGR